jgi:hypothetical protein
VPQSSIFEGWGFSLYLHRLDQRTVDNAGHRTSVAELSGRKVNYGYDNLYRLTSEAIASDPASMNGAVS